MLKIKKKDLRKFLNKKYLIIGVVGLLLVISLILGFKNFKNNNRDERQLVSLDTVIKDAQAQSYAASASPTLKDGDKIFGSAKSELKIFVYEDYTNYYCSKLADTLDRIQAEFGDKVAIIVRPYVLKNSPSSLQAAVAVDCAGEQDKWIAMRALLFAAAKNKQVAVVNFEDYGQQIGLNEEKFAECLTKVQKSEKIEKSTAEALNYKVQGAPTMFMGSEMILGARPYEDYIDSNGDKIQGLKTLITDKLK